MVDGQYGERPTSLAGLLHLPFGLLIYSCLQFNKLPLIHIHSSILTLITLLPHLSGMYPEIQCLSVEQIFVEDLTAVL